MNTLLNEKYEYWTDWYPLEPWQEYNPNKKWSRKMWSVFQRPCWEGDKNGRYINCMLAFIGTTAFVQQMILDGKQKTELSYAEYLRSDMWKTKREIYYRLYAADDNIYEHEPKRVSKRVFCHDCLMENKGTTYERNKVHLHHLTYARIGMEDFDDLILLCEHHHKLRHNMVKNISSK